MPPTHEAPSEDTSENFSSKEMVTARIMLRKKLPSQADFEAFCTDCFPEIQGVYFAVGMDRLQRESLLLQQTSGKEVVAALDRWLAYLAFSAAKLKSGPVTLAANAAQPLPFAASSLDSHRHASADSRVRQLTRAMVWLGLLGTLVLFWHASRSKDASRLASPPNLAVRNTLAPERAPLARYDPAPRPVAGTAAPAAPSLPTALKKQAATFGPGSLRSKHPQRTSRHKEKKNERVPVVDTE